MKTKKQAQHTPTPWAVSIGPPEHCEIVKTMTRIIPVPPREGIVATVEYGIYGTAHNHLEADANAAFIVRAVNSHEGLVDACRGLLKKESELKTGKLYLEFRAIETALKAAGEGV